MYALNHVLKKNSKRKTHVFWNVMQCGLVVDISEWHSASIISVDGFWLFTYPDEEGKRFLWNTGIHLPHYKTHIPRQQYAQPLPWKPKSCNSECMHSNAMHEFVILLLCYFALSHHSGVSTLILCTPINIHQLKYVPNKNRGPQYDLYCNTPVLLNVDPLLMKTEHFWFDMHANKYRKGYTALIQNEIKLMPQFLPFHTSKDFIVALI